MLNLAVMTGRMVETPELKTTQNNVSVTSFRIAVTRNYKVNDEYPTDFFNVVAWRGTAEFAAKYFKKGDLFTVEGQFETRKYTDKNGNKWRRSSLLRIICISARAKRKQTSRRVTPKLSRVILTRSEPSCLIFPAEI